MIKNIPTCERGWVTELLRAEHNIQGGPAMMSHQVALRKPPYGGWWGLPRKVGQKLWLSPFEYLLFFKLWGLPEGYLLLLYALGHGGYLKQNPTNKSNGGFLEVSWGLPINTMVTTWGLPLLWGLPNQIGNNRGYLSKLETMWILMGAS